MTENEASSYFPNNDEAIAELERIWKVLTANLNDHEALRIFKASANRYFMDGKFSTNQQLQQLINERANRLR